MPFDGQALGALARETDDVIRSFGMRATAANLFAMAEEMRHRLRIYPAGPVRAAQIAGELRRRAIHARAYGLGTWFP